MNNAFFIGLVSWSDDGPFFYVSRFAEFHFTSCSFPFLSHFWSAAFLFPFLFDMFDYLLLFFIFFRHHTFSPRLDQTDARFTLLPTRLEKKRTTSLSTPRPYTDLKIPAVAWLTPIMPRPLVINHPLSYFCVLYVANVCPFLFSYVSLLVSYHLSYLRLALVFALHQKATFSLLFLSFFLFSLDWKNMISLYK